MKNDRLQRIAVLGASRGLGEALVKHIQSLDSYSCLLTSRKSELLTALARKGRDTVLKADFTTTAGQTSVLEAIKEFLPHQVFYVAGGGPYGAFAEKKFKDHMWALEVGLVFPMKVIHTLLTTKEFDENLHKIAVVGSAIAGQSPDPFASAYAAAKHGLRGLVKSIQAEKPKIELKIFEPGYIDTELLPPNAWPRQHGIVARREDEARRLWQWSQNSIE
jgi:short-subunit dehydrogenase